MDKDLKKELYRYCQHKYRKEVERLSAHNEKYSKTGKRPVGATGKDLIDYTSKKLLMYHSGLVELSDGIDWDDESIEGIK